MLQRPVVKCYMAPPIARVLSSPKPIKILSGGRSSTKTWGVANYQVAKAKDTRQRFLCTRELQISISASVHQVLKDRIYSMGLSKFFHITDEKIKSYSGSNFIFKGLRANITELKGLEGIDSTWVEEGESWTQDCIDVLLPTIIRRKCELIITFNPCLETDPVITNFVKPYLEGTGEIAKLIEYAHVTYKDNPFLTDMEKALIEHHKKVDYEHYEWIWEGKYKKYAEALVFKGKYIVEEFEAPSADTQFYYGADFGFSNDPAVLVRCFIKDHKLFVDQEAYGRGVEISDLARFYESVPGCYDWQIRADSARPDTISHLFKQGFNIVGAEKGANSIEEGISFLKQFEKIIIHPRCKGTIHDFGNYKHKQDRITGEILPLLIDKHNDVIDSLRYAIEPYSKAKATIFDLY